MRTRQTVSGVILLVCVLLSTRVGASKVWNPTDLPSPQNDAKGICGRGGTKSAVCDPDGMLSVSDRDSVDGLINFIAEGTNGYEVAQCGQRIEGYQFAVLIIERMDSSYHRFSSTADRAKRFAKDIHDSWSVGDAECQNGVVLFISIADREMYISTGRGVKGILTDSMVQNVLSHMKPLMRQEEYGRAIFAGVQRMGNILSGKVPSDVELDSGVPGFLFVLGCGMMMILFCDQCVQSTRKRREYKRCKAALRRIDDDTDAARQGAYKATSCPICLEPFEKEEEKDKKNSDDGQGISGNTDESDVALLGEISEEKDENVRVALPCGHQFRSKCILEWTKKSDESGNRMRCPVCRAPIDGSGRDEAEQRPSDMAGFDEERRFRIGRAHDLYPDYVTYEMMNRYRDDHNTRMETHQQFVDLDPVVMEAAREAGLGGSTFSFGGGDSSGGGGGGSSW